LSFFAELKRRNVVKVSIAYIVMAWLVLQVADVVLNNIEAPGWVFQVIMLLLGLGLPVAIFFSWAFELTPEGLKLEKDVDRTESITHQTGRKLDFMIIGVLVAALGYFAFDKFVLDASRDAALVEAATQAGVEQAASEDTSRESDNSIAVLPFVNMSDDASNEYFSDGISEELLNLLAKVPELKVAARTSSFSLKGKDLQISEIGKVLKVAHVLEGSVRKAGNQVRITTQLIKTDDGYHMWSQTYDRSLDNIFAVQDEIAASVVDQLKVTLLGETPKATEVNGEAYALFLQARQLGRLFTIDGFDQSNALYEQILEVAPGYATVYTELGSNYINQAGIGMLSVSEATNRARETIKKALEIDPQNGNAHALLGWIAMIYENELPEAAKHFQKALVLDPRDLRVISNSAVLAASLARMEEAVTLMEYVAERDPVDPKAHGNLALAYALSGQPEKSIESSQASLRLSPGRIGQHETLSMAYLMKGEPESAMEAIEQEEYEEGRDTMRAMVLYSLAHEAEFEEALQLMISRWSEESPGRVASVYAWSGQLDDAFEWLDKAIAINDSNLVRAPVDPTLANLHVDPRWMSFLERIGKSPEQLAAIEFKVTLP
jgi:TolB-like protein/lipoprotein NlpI